MLKDVETTAFEPVNRGYDAVFQPKRLSIGLVVPLEAYPNGPAPTLTHHLERVQQAEELGFSAVWLRDVPFNVPSFGDAGQMLDPFVYLGYLAARTRRIALGVSSIILPLRHPAHVAKPAASVDALSDGRVILGVASGDRPDEYPAMNVSYVERGPSFRESFDYIRKIAAPSPAFQNAWGTLDGTIDLLPKPVGSRLPLLITGGSQQDADWIAQHGDGWMIYPRNTPAQSSVVRDYRARVLAAGDFDKPVMQPLYVDLAEDPSEPPRPIHLGFRSGASYLREYLLSLAEIGINHVALNLRFNTADIPATLERLANDVLADFQD